MPHFRAADFGPVAAALLDLRPAPMIDLGPGTPHSAARDLLNRLTPAALCAPGAVANAAMAAGCCAGLWLWHNYLDESHKLSQEIETPEGSFWHGIMHRREPDPANSKYWFRRVGRHAVFEPLCQAAAVAARKATPDPSAVFLTDQPAWDPYRWIDLCEQARTGGTSTATADLCRRIQELEWQLLFTHCYRAATKQ